MARPVTEAPETQIYFITHRSGAFLVLRQRTVVRGERASRSIVNRTTALWSIWMVASLIVAGSTYLPLYAITWGRGMLGQSAHIRNSPRRGAHSPWHDAAAMAWRSAPSGRRRTKDYLPATQPEESITPQSSRSPNELFASEEV